MLYQFFSFMNPVISVTCENSVPQPRSQIFLLCFLLGVYILILALGFRFIDHYTLMFVNAIFGSSFIFLGYMGI